MITKQQYNSNNNNNNTFRSVINTWHKDWGTLKWGDVPDHLQASKYPSTQANKEEWEDEMLTEWTKRRRTSIIDDQDLF